MFNFLKDKLKSWFKKSEKVIEIKAKKKEKPAKAKKAEKPKKQERKKRTKSELEQERKVSGEIVEDIKKERGEEIRPIPRQEEIEAEIEEVKAEHEQEEKQKEKKSWFGKIFSRKYTISESEFSEIFESLETILLENNVALEVVDYLKENLKNQLVNKEIEKDDLEKEIKSALKNAIESLFVPSFNLESKIKEKKPFTIAFFGVNGSGKTTTLAKLAYELKQKGFSVILAAADTFRAASIEQLKIHGDKLGVKVISQNYGSDPAAVAYDAVEYAKSHKIDVVLIDTAGRMHTKENLIKEMGKIVRVSKPDLKIFIGEAITGNDATEQAKTFNEAISIDGIILSKQDIDEKGGTSLSVSYITKKPILFLGMGQEYKDLEAFDKDKLIEKLGL